MDDAAHSAHCGDGTTKITMLHHSSSSTIGVNNSSPVGATPSNRGSKIAVFHGAAVVITDACSLGRSHCNRGTDIAFTDSATIVETNTPYSITGSGHIGLALAAYNDGTRQVLSCNACKVGIWGGDYSRHRCIGNLAVSYLTTVNVTKRRDTLRTAGGDSSVTFNGDTRDMSCTADILENGDITVVGDAWMGRSVRRIIEMSHEIVDGGGVPVRGSEDYV